MSADGPTFCPPAPQLRRSASRRRRVGGAGNGGDGDGGAQSPAGSYRGSPNKGYSFDNVEQESYFAVQARRGGSLMIQTGNGTMFEDDAILQASLADLSPPVSPAVSAIWANVRRSVFGPTASGGGFAAPGAAASFNYGGSGLMSASGLLRAVSPSRATSPNRAASPEPSLAEEP